MVQPHIRTGLLVNFRSTVRDLGADPLEVIQFAGLREDILHNPDSFMPYKDYLALLDTAALLTGCPHFGLEMSRELGAMHLGVTGFVMTQADNVRGAWESLARFYHTHDT